MSINQAMFKVCKYYYKSSEVQIVYITGERNYEKIKDKLEKDGIDVSNKNIKLKSYLHNMEWAYAAADLIVYRAGATGLAEITARGIPAILIPYPHATGNHQEYNAKNLEKHGAAVVISDKNLNSKILLKRIKYLFSNKNILENMAKKSKEMGNPRAAEDLAVLIDKMVEKSQ